MNEKIKKYWETFRGKAAILDENGYFYHIEANTGGHIIIAVRYDVAKLISSWSQVLPSLHDKEWVYPFNGSLNDEETMLKLLKLKAFL